jgi:type IV secretion system protein VirB1
MFDFLALAQECAPNVAPATMMALAQVESAHNPYAIGVVDGWVKQPVTLDEAVKTAKALEAEGKNFSLGIAQVNRYNLARHGLDYATAFEPCANLRAGAKILEECYSRASKRYDNTQAALHAALSCYYSGNFTRGFKPDAPGKTPYVYKVLAAAGIAAPVVPSLTDPPRPTEQGKEQTAPPRPPEEGPVQLRAESGDKPKPPLNRNPKVML